MCFIELDMHILSGIHVQIKKGGMECKNNVPWVTFLHVLYTETPH